MRTGILPAGKEVIQLSLKMRTWKVEFIVSYLVFQSVLLITIEAIGRPMGTDNSIGEYGPQNFPPKPYSFNYEVTDEHGNVHYRREEGDPSGAVVGSYGYTNVNGLFRSVDYMADAGGFRAKVKTNEPGTKGPGSADAEVQADPSPQGMMGVIESKPPAVVPAATRRNYWGLKG